MLLPADPLAGPQMQETAEPIYLPLIAAGPSQQTPTGDSFQRIDQALADGVIDETTALLYRLYALFGDERLPTVYRGAPGDAIDHHAVSLDASERFDELPPEVQSLVGPFLVPPFYRGSWVDRPSRHSADPVPPCGPRDACDLSEAWTHI